MRHADSISDTAANETLPPPMAGRAVPTFIATALLEKLIAERDAQAVHKVVTTRR